MYLHEYETTTLHTLQFSEKFSYRRCLSLCANYKATLNLSHDELEKKNLIFRQIWCSFKNVGHMEDL
jgi:hypothetical protein